MIWRGVWKWKRYNGFPPSLYFKHSKHNYKWYLSFFFFLFFFFMRCNFHLWMFCPSQIYNFHLLRSWMQLVQSFICSLFMSLLMSLSHLFFGLPSGLLTSDCTYILFLPYSLQAFDVNGQANLFFLLLYGLLYSYVFLALPVHRLFWFSTYRFFLL
jgi:hypothetical protein